MARKKKETIIDYPLTAMDLGSHTMKAMAVDVETDESGFIQLRVLGTEQNNSGNSIVDGWVQNASTAGFMIGKTLHLLANRVGHSSIIPAVYLPMGGKDMGATAVGSKRSLGVKTTIIPSVIREMQRECIAKVAAAAKTTPLQCVGLIPFYTLLDGERYPGIAPSNVRGKDIQGVYSAFYTQPKLVEDFLGSLARCNRVAAGTFPRAQTLVEALVSEEDDNEGVAIVDMGAETTTVVVYRQGEYRKNVVIAMGGKNITMDIQQQGILMEHAEKLKCTYGETEERFLTQNPTIRIPASVPGQPPVKIDLKMLTKIISSRLDEILERVLKVIEKEQDHISRIYVTGGASKLNHLVEFFQEKTPLPVEYGSHGCWLTPDTPDEYCDPQYSCLIGTLLLATKNRQSAQLQASNEDLGLLGGMKKKFTDIANTILFPEETDGVAEPINPANPADPANPVIQLPDMDPTIE